VYYFSILTIVLNIIYLTILCCIVAVITIITTFIIILFWNSKYAVPSDESFKMYIDNIIDKNIESETSGFGRFFAKLGFKIGFPIIKGLVMGYEFKNLVLFKLAKLSVEVKKEKHKEFQCFVGFYDTWFPFSNELGRIFFYDYRY